MVTDGPAKPGVSHSKFMHLVPPPLLAQMKLLLQLIHGVMAKSHSTYLGVLDSFPPPTLTSKFISVSLQISPSLKFGAAKPGLAL